MLCQTLHAHLDGDVICPKRVKDVAADLDRISKVSCRRKQALTVRVTTHYEHDHVQWPQVGGRAAGCGATLSFTYQPLYCSHNDK
jgi:hypothetical protein